MCIHVGLHLRCLFLDPLLVGSVVIGEGDPCIGIIGIQVELAHLGLSAPRCN